ncbi:sulfatase-like hydrolase/transferase [Flammeovirga aprica JL-4]|uniref:Sulfatase-like hydrolase/transferase n=2 Tax=Flammeovirga aprica TaxID=29528 RepID=A0A7X9XD35_9BACT|nr:sulfatase-like hydrolase/transferase [Flammeovirga aprica JL-4]
MSYSKLVFLALLIFGVNKFANAEDPLEKNKRKKDKRPNIVFILTDDQGYGDLGCFGSKTISTPNIDKLSDEGIKFTNFYVHNRCSPTRMAFMTGAYAHRTELPRVIYWFDRMGIHEDEITTAELLKEAGYKTGIIGKWHLGDWDEFHPNKNGFDHFYGFLEYGRAKTAIYRNKTLVENIKKKTHGQHSPKLVKEAVKFIKDNKEQPFFLYYASPLPHTPFLPSQKFKGTSNQGAYGDQVQDIDWQVGELMKALKENGIDDNTLVIYTSDNGPELGLPQTHGTSGILRDGKWSNFEGGIRVPCVARWPKQMPKGEVNNEIVGIIDMLPTFCALSGASVPTDRPIDGRNIVPYLQGKTSDASIHETIIVPGKVIRHNEWKYAFEEMEAGGPIQNLGDRKHAPRGTLFNLKDDPSETVDVSKEHPDKVKELDKMMREFLSEMRKNIKPIGKTAEFTDELLKAEWKYQRAPRDQKPYYKSVVDSLLQK